MLSLDEILKKANEMQASDVHIREGEPILYRIHGDMNTSLSPDPVKRTEIVDILEGLLKRNKEREQTFEKNHEIDFGYIHTDGIAYRGNAYIFLEKIGIALRRIADKAISIEDLGLPPSIEKVLNARQGLFLVTGPTGSGKSTTMVSILDTINRMRKEHIITIEDPVEFIFKNKQSIFSQREVGRDTYSFASAIRAAMREDPDIVVIGEMRDAETVESALSLAETGHLVISTLHTSGSVQTLSRIIQFFPTEAENQIKTRLGDSLIGVLSQRLIPRKDTKGLIAIRELMYVNSGIRNLIKSGDFKQIYSTIETSSQEGMITMRKHADTLAQKGIVDPREYMGYFVNTND